MYNNFDTLFLFRYHQGFIVIAFGSCDIFMQGTFSTFSMLIHANEKITK